MYDALTARIAERGGFHAAGLASRSRRVAWVARAHHERDEALEPRYADGDTLAPG